MVFGTCDLDGDDTHVCTRNSAGEACVAASQLFLDEGVGEYVAAGSAVFLREGEGRQTKVTSFLVKLGRKLARYVAFLADGNDTLIRKLADHLLDLSLFICEKMIIVLHIFPPWIYIYGEYRRV